MIRSRPAPARGHIWARVQKERFVLSLVMFAVAILVSRVSVFGQIAPLAPAFAAAAFAAGLSPYAVGLGCIAGSMTMFSALPAPLAATATVVALGALFSLRQQPGARRMFIALGAAVAAAELIFRTMLTYDLIMALLELSGAVVMYLVFFTAASVIKGKRRKSVLSEEELLCVALAACTLLLGAAPLHIGWFWPTAALCTLVTLACAYWGSAGTGAAVGLACGLALSLSGQVNVLFIGNLGAIGLTSGLLRRYKKAGVIAGAVLANALITLYANGSSFTILSFADVLLAGMLMLLLPNTYLNAVGKSVDFILRRQASERHYLEMIRVIVLEHLNAMAELLARMGRTLENAPEPGNGLLVGQMEGASRLMGHLARAFDVQVRFEKDLEASVRSRLEAEGFRVREVAVAQKMFGALRVQVSLSGCSMRAGCDAAIVGAVSTGAMASMRITGRSCPGTGGKACSLTLEEVPAFSVQVGKAQSAQSGDVNGDSLVCTRLGSGKYLLCISDGMGSGEQAHARLDKGTIFRSLNQLMVLRGEEMFSTVDLCVVDLLEGRAEFVKVGAAPSLVRQNGRFECLQATTLPMGILDSVSMQSTVRVLAHDDVIVMMSDGVTDALGENMKDVVEFILTSRNLKPGRAARMIREAAAAALDGVQRDDMTVVVARVVRNAA